MHICYIFKHLKYSCCCLPATGGAITMRQETNMLTSVCLYACAHSPLRPKQHKMSGPTERRVQFQIVYCHSCLHRSSLLNLFISLSNFTTFLDLKSNHHYHAINHKARSHNIRYWPQTR